MKLRLKFRKTGRLKYIGHLDLLNVFNRAIKSAKLPVSYSNGFNPHMLVVFADPLPLGITSVSEYVDISFSDELFGSAPLLLDDTETGLFQQKADELVSRLNGRLPNGLFVTNVYMLTEPYKKAPSVVAKASYDITGFKISDERLNSFMALDTFEIMKKTKRKTELVNIKPDIYEVSVIENGVSALLSCGSRKNLKASLFIEALCDFLEIKTPLYKLHIERTEIFGSLDTDGSHGFFPLSRLI